MLTKRLLIVDEQPLFRQGLREILRQTPHLRPAGEAAAAHQALQLATHLKPHLAIVSDTLPGITGLTLIASLASLRRRCPAVAIVSEITQDSLRVARQAGAVGIISRSIEPADLPAALDRAIAVCDGRRMPEPHPSSGPFILSARELEILDCVAHGFSNREIADALFVTEQTVKNHMTSVFRKLEVEDRVQALLAAVRRGWVTFGPVPSYDARARRFA